MSLWSLYIPANNLIDSGTPVIRQGYRCSPQGFYFNFNFSHMDNSLLNSVEFPPIFKSKVGGIYSLPK